MLFWRSPESASTLHGRFEQQAAARPRAIAVEWDGVRLTYREVNEAANRLAQRLIGAKVEADAPVLVAMQRSSDMIVALLAVLKAGGVFVLAEGLAPGAELEARLSASGARVVLTDAPRPFVARGVRLVSAFVASGLASNPRARTQPDRWACEVGGKIRSHEAVLRILDAMGREQEFGAGDGLFNGVDLDGPAVVEILLPLVAGGRLVLATHEEMRDPVRLENAIRAANCKVVRVPASPEVKPPLTRAAFA